MIYENCSEATGMGILGNFEGEDCVVLGRGREEEEMNDLVCCGGSPNVLSLGIC